MWVPAWLPDLGCLTCSMSLTLFFTTNDPTMVMVSRAAKSAEEARGTAAGLPQLRLAKARSFQAMAVTFTTDAAVAAAMNLRIRTRWLRHAAFVPYEAIQSGGMASQRTA